MNAFTKWLIYQSNFEAKYGSPPTPTRPETCPPMNELKAKLTQEYQILLKSPAPQRENKLALLRTRNKYLAEFWQAMSPQHFNLIYGGGNSEDEETAQEIIREINNNKANHDFKLTEFAGFILVELSDGRFGKHASEVQRLFSDIPPRNTWETELARWQAKRDDDWLEERAALKQAQPNEAADKMEFSKMQLTEEETEKLLVGIADQDDFEEEIKLPGAAVKYHQTSLAKKAAPTQAQIDKTAKKNDFSGPILTEDEVANLLAEIAGPDKGRGGRTHAARKA